MPPIVADLPPPTSYGSQPVSQAGITVERMQSETDRLISSSVTFGKKTSDLLNELIDIYEESLEADWDGYGSGPIDETALVNAANVIKALPRYVPAPELAPTSFGEIDFDWRFGHMKTLNISITDTSELIYAYMIGAEKGHGSVPFDGTFPKALVDFFRRIHA